MRVESSAGAAAHDGGWAAWAGRGMTAALEQGSVSISNLVLSVALARWLDPADYGAYAVAFSMLLLGAAIYQSILLVPLLVHVPQLERARRAGYLTTLLRMHGIGAAIVLAIAAAACSLWAVRTGNSALALLAFSSVVTVVAITFHWLLRDMHYSVLSPFAPARGSILYAVAMLLALGFLWRADAAAPWTAILAMGLAAFVAGASQFPALRAQLTNPDKVSIAEVLRASRRSGRWEAWIAIASWAPVHLTFPVTAGILGPGMTGALRALQNFAMPLNQIVVALSRLVLPYLCGRSGSGESPIAQGRRIAWVAIAAGTVYTAVLWLVAAPLVHMLYGGAYDQHAWLMPLAILPMAFWGGAQSLGLALRAAGRFPSVLVGSLAAGIVFAASVAPATKAFGITGALGSAAVAQMLGLALLAGLSRTNAEPSPALSPMPADGGGA